MNPSPSTLIAPRNGIISITHSLYLGAGIYALACAPAILLAEKLGWSQSFFHLTQLVATILCFPAAAFFLWQTRALRFTWARGFAFVACALSALWLAFMIYLLLSLDFRSME